MIKGGCKIQGIIIKKYQVVKFHQMAHMGASAGITLLSQERFCISCLRVHKFQKKLPASRVRVSQLPMIVHATQAAFISFLSKRIFIGLRHVPKL